MKILAVWLALCGCAMGAQDERFGFATHFHYEFSRPEQNPVDLIPRIAATTPAAWIREDIGMVDGVSLDSAGNVVYINGTGIRTSDQQIIDLAVSNGLKVVLILNQYYTPLFWPNPQAWLADSSGTSPAARYAAQVAKTEEARLGVGKIAIEVFNEPNNSRTFFGATWPSSCALATKLIADAVHAVSSVKVIGLGAQGVDILSMLGMQTDVDGVVFHDDNGGNVNDVIYQGGTGGGITNPEDYRAWIGLIQKTAPGLPIWITEEAENGGLSEYESAVFIAHRIFINAWYGISHNFLHEYISSDTAQSTLSYQRMPRHNEGVINTVYRLLAADPWNPGTPMVGGNQLVSRTDAADPNFVGLYFEVPNPGHWPSTTMAVCFDAYGPYLNALAVPAQITVYHPVAGTVLATDLISGRSWHLINGVDWHQSGLDVVITNAQVGQGGMAYKIWNGAVVEP